MAHAQPRRLDFEALLDYALRLLGARAHTVSELSAKLRRRAGKQDDAARVLARLKECGYLDDRRFAAAFAASRLENQGFGRGRVLRDLRARRVAPAVAEQAVAAAYQNTDETAMIEAFLTRKYRRTALGPYLTEPKHLASVYRKLRLAGFSSPAVVRVLKRYAEAAADLESLEDDQQEP
jgi:regulatory protein